ncbi:MFS transporter [Massilia cavernae]|uniref:MFS transporter n=2 Tax=Massilia cavernae TaxID=2320864 RepID=A0A418XXT4_9BURK|nr:MFS transporter [Massilia cavernae]
MTRDSHRFVLGTVMLGHFVAAFAALGMPPFFGLILDKSLHSDAAWLAGCLYVLPIFFTAISSPWWGMLADRYGKKLLLLRAQLGLAGSFLLAGFAPNVWVFVLALLLQGVLGGTFSASNAYLATVFNGAALTRSLTLMQWSARAALVVAPTGLGWLIATAESPLVLYRYVAVLPLAAALFIWRLPDQSSTAQARAREPVQATTAQASPAQIYWLQFAFIFATVITFPYFVPFLSSQAGIESSAMAGLMFGLPHLVYLVGALPLSRGMGQRTRILSLGLSFLLVAAALLGQAWAPSLPAMAIWRAAMGLGMTAAYISLHGLIAGLVNSGNAGATFGWFESSSKWGAVLAGLTAGVASHALDVRAPFVAGALVMFAAGCYLAGLAVRRHRLCHS